MAVTLKASIRRAGQARGVWLDVLPDARAGEIWPRGSDVAIWAVSSDWFHIARRGAMLTVVDGLTTALWMLASELPETTRRCSDCERRGGGWQWTWTTCPAQRDDAEAQGWTAGRVPSRAPGDSGVVLVRVDGVMVDGYRVNCYPCVRPCPTCTADGEPTGRVPRSWGAVLLGALANNHADREALAVKADGLQARGDPLGEWLALWLAGTKCTACAGRGCGEDHGGFVPDCIACRGEDDRGTGRELARHTEAIAAALDTIGDQEMTT